MLGDRYRHKAATRHQDTTPFSEGLLVPGCMSPVESSWSVTKCRALARRRLRCCEMLCRSRLTKLSTTSILAALQWKRSDLSVGVPELPLVVGEHS